MPQQKKKVVILGSTGSIGLSSIDVLEHLSDQFELVGASAHGSWRELAQQALRFDLEQVVLTDERHYPDLKEVLSGQANGKGRTEILVGAERLVDLATDPQVDIVIVAVVGAAALPAVIAAARAGKRVAIANKESLVMAGGLIMPLARESGAQVLPVDSEHSAILQAMHSGEVGEVDKVLLTCSGGAFREKTADELSLATVEDALCHPTWQMGPKITIDSATLMNKALEVIEARWLIDSGWISTSI